MFLLKHGLNEVSSLQVVSWLGNDGQSFFNHVFTHVVNFGRSWSSGYSLVFAGFVTWAVLVHDVDSGVWTDLISKKVNNLKAAGKIIWQNKMSDQEAAFS